MTKKENKDFQYKCLFDRLNSKYNRLWEQITSLVILFIEVFTGYSFAILAVGKDNLILSIYVTLIIVVILIGIAIAIGRLFYEKADTKRGLLNFINC